jgi:hypothetical protein
LKIKHVTLEVEKRGTYHKFSPSIVKNSSCRLCLLKHFPFFLFFRFENKNINKTLFQIKNKKRFSKTH